MSGDKRININGLENRYEEIKGYQELCSLIPENIIPGYSSMWLAVKVMENDRVVIARLKNALDDVTFKKLEKIKNDLLNGPAELYFITLRFHLRLHLLLIMLVFLSGKRGKNEPCRGCLPEDGFKNMGQMWEVI